MRIPSCARPFATAGLACALAVTSLFGLFTGCGRGPEIAPHDPTGHAARLTTVAILLAGAPNAHTVTLAGARAEGYRELLTSCGRVVTDRVDRAEIAFFAPGAAASALPSDAFDRARVVVEALDVRGLKAPQLEARLRPYAGRAATLWMPGEHDWVVVARATTNGVSYSDLAQALGGDAAASVLGAIGCDAAVELFASYVGTVDEVMPAFATKLEGDVVPQWFVPREVPEVRGLDFSAVDARIRQKLLGEIRSRQNIRRQVLKANMLSQTGQEDAAIDGWAKALRLNPCEPLLLERLGVLGVNARTFRSLGKLTLAAKCYETMARLCPADPHPLTGLADCLDALGKRDLANLARERARKLGPRP